MTLPAHAVLVTGGTGTLGRTLVPLLLAAGHDVRVLSRREAPAVPAGATAVRGDVRTGEGIEAAVAGVDVVVHAASNPRRRARETELAGTRNVAAAARTQQAHVVYPSIVGVDRHRFPYYRAKHAAEQALADSGAGWSVLRATQFHDLLDLALGTGWFVRTRRLRFQPVDVREVARRLTELVAGPPLGLVPDFAGPEVLTVGELARIRSSVTGSRTRLVPLPAVGFLGDFDAGLHLSPDCRAGTTTWRDWLLARR